MTHQIKERAKTFWERLKDAMLVTLFIKVIFFSGGEVFSLGRGVVVDFKQLKDDRDTDKVRHAELMQDLSINRGRWIMYDEWKHGVDTELVVINKRLQMCEEPLGLR